MTAISTGGFTLTPSSFELYSLPIKLASLLLMIIGACSFALHYQLLRRGRWKLPFLDHQHRLLLILLTLGSFFIWMINYFQNGSPSWIDSGYQWISALTTCGFSSASIRAFTPSIKLCFVIAMIMGGAKGSTAGGIKMKRVIDIFTGLKLRIFSLMRAKEKSITNEYHPNKAPSIRAPADIDLPKSAKSSRLFSANTFFFLWINTLVIGWFLVLLYLPEAYALDALFDVASAMSNVGLSSVVITPDLPTGAKCIFIFLMGLGRLEIIPAIIVLLSIPLFVIRPDHSS